VGALRRSWPAIAGLAVVVSILLGIGWLSSGNSLPEWLKPGWLGSSPAASPVGTPMFGTNMALYDANDQILNDLGTQRILKRAHVAMIRMPFRSATGDLSEVKGLRAIQYVGAIPIVIVHGPDDHNALADDRALIQLTRGVFGSGRVYVEFGNEPELGGYSVRSYTAAWNGVVPALKAIAGGYQFIGPAASSADTSYIAAFDALARPRPDANSWHEYACSTSDLDRVCTQTVAAWPQHVRQVARAVKAAIGTTLPLLLTEWNLDANPDPRMQDASFMNLWTAQAMQALADAGPDGLVAALQYCAAGNPNFSLIGPDNSLTAEGEPFFQALATRLQPRST
jgi:hypothetical protein